MSNNKSTTMETNETTQPGAIAERVSERARTGVSSAADRLGDGLDRTADGLRGVSDKVANRIDGAGEYLHRSDAKSLAADMMDVVKRHPKTAIAIGLGLGFMMYRLLR
jgi:hypothetical protein